MGKVRSRANGNEDVFPCKKKAGKITLYRGAYVEPEGKRRYVSGKPQVDARRNLCKARGDAERGLVSDGGNVRLSEYLTPAHLQRFYRSKPDEGLSTHGSVP